MIVAVVVWLTYLLRTKVTVCGSVKVRSNKIVRFLIYDIFAQDRLYLYCLLGSFLTLISTLLIWTARDPDVGQQNITIAQCRVKSRITIQFKARQGWRCCGIQSYH